MTLDRISEIAKEHARHVCESGSPAADRHNQKTIESAIQTALIEHERERKRDRQASNRRMQKSRERRRRSGDRSPAVP